MTKLKGNDLEVKRLTLRPPNQKESANPQEPSRDNSMLIVLRPEVAKCEMTMALHQSPNDFPLIPKQNGAVRMNHNPHAHREGQNPQREGSGG